MSNEDRVVNPISTGELERRWSAVRAAMKEQGVDVLLMQNSNEFHGGYVKYFTDIPARHGGYENIIFPIDEEAIQAGVHCSLIQITALRNKEMQRNSRGSKHISEVQSEPKLKIFKTIRSRFHDETNGEKTPSSIYERNK